MTTMRWHWVMGGVLGVASLALAGGATTTTPTTSTTTTTLVGGCEDAAIFESILCRLDALVAYVDASTDLGKMKAGLAKSAARARSQCTTASTSSGKTTTNQLKRCAKTLSSFRHRVGSLNGRKIIPDEVRALLRDGIAGPIRTDVQTLRATL